MTRPKSHGTSIEWTQRPGTRGETWNPVVGCTRVSAGCDHCYAVRTSHRLEHMGQKRYEGLTVLNGRGDRHFAGVVRTVPEALAKPLGWREPRTVFVNSMSDLFHPEVPSRFVDQVVLVMQQCPQHTFLILTKRPARMREYFDKPRRSLANVWLGTSAEDQAALDSRLPDLIALQERFLVFLSCEPLLGSIWLNDAMERSRVDWVIAGGESGPGARPMHPDWPRWLQMACHTYDVPFFFKQWGAWRPRGEHEPAKPVDHQFDDGVWMCRNQRKSFAELDGRHYREWPEGRTP